MLSKGLSKVIDKEVQGAGNATKHAEDDGTVVDGASLD